MERPYHGRFAPSPTGPLHFGSLVAAVASYLQARSQGGRWSLRIEDVDRHRCRPQWAEAIPKALLGLGMEWDGPVTFQSRHEARYLEALAHLREQGLLYACRCSRRTLAQIAPRGPLGPIYPGLCRNANLADGPQRALRLRVAGVEQARDPVMGTLEQDLERDLGDFVLRRADGLFAYQLAVVVDDLAQGITEVVRGADLWDNTPRQRYLARCLGGEFPATVHVPVAVDDLGRKLSKSSGAAALDLARPGAEIVRALTFLGQAPPAALARAPLKEIWDWAIAHWNLQRIPRRREIPELGLEGR